MELIQSTSLENEVLGSITPLTSPEDGWVEIPKKKRKYTKRKSKGKKAEDAAKKESEPKGTKRKDNPPPQMKRFHTVFRYRDGGTVHIFIDAMTGTEACTKAYRKILFNRRTMPDGKMLENPEEVDMRGWERHPFTDYEKNWRF